MELRGNGGEGKTGITHSLISDWFLIKPFEGLTVGRMDGNEEIFGKLMGDRDFRKVVSEHLLHKVFMTVNASDGIRLEKEG